EQLDAGVHAIGKKVVEEAAEVWMAARYETNDETAEEISQLLYHLQVKMLAKGISLEDVYKYLKLEESSAKCCALLCPTRAHCPMQLVKPSLKLAIGNAEIPKSWYSSTRKTVSNFFTCDLETLRST